MERNDYLCTSDSSMNLLVNGPSHLKSTPPLWKILEFQPKSSCSVIPDPNNYQKINVSDPDKISNNRYGRTLLNGILAGIIQRIHKSYKIQPEWQLILKSSSVFSWNFTLKWQLFPAEIKGTYRDHRVTGALNFHKIRDFCILVMVFDVLT